ncbi:hypothetical protein BKA62DRAFT_740279 [Auriculariales sp. MPI-PUGE-AT-0066]|nr:hypothetical protein BKA62DRAFT_740279 [Auriculariales sp. MPI-PUGE-AT-0066]
MIAPKIPAHELELQIQRARAAVENQPDNHSYQVLNRQLWGRFVRDGNIKDARECLQRLGASPLPNLDEFNPRVTQFRPELTEDERRWARWQPWLLASGYNLYRRFDPTWIPPWIASGKSPQLYADYPNIMPKHVMPAIRTGDEKMVWLKLCPLEDIEVAAHIYFASEPQRSDPRNHCCRILDIVLTPLIIDGQRQCLIVLPMLRDVTRPAPRTLGELLQCILQLAEGLSFMHEHNFAHRDIHVRNVMMDASQLIPDGWNPWMVNSTYPDKSDGPVRKIRALSRSKVDVQYFYIDFGLSVKFPDAQPRGTMTGTGGLNRNVPELSDIIPYDPFPVDIYMFGDMLRDLSTVRKLHWRNHVPGN